MICRRCLVSGRVQGVFFRASVLRLGVRGLARNLPDGRVEVLACGSPESVDGLCAWLRSGPPLARVTGVECSLVEVTAPDGFRVA